MTEQSYPDGAALWRALTTRAKALAVDSSSDSGAIVRRFVFERFLARVFHHPERPWVLKGGTALLARVHDARTTKDIDLYRRDRDLAAAVRELREVVEIDLADHFRFAITNVEILPGGDGQPRVQGARLSVDAYIGIARKQTFTATVRRAVSETSSISLFWHARNRSSVRNSPKRSTANGTTADSRGPHT